MEPIEISAFPGRSIQADQQTWLYFGGTAYLGLQAEQSFQEILIANIRRYGSSYGASRNANVSFSLFEEVERELAGWMGAERALTVSSGYLAGQLVCQTLREARCDLLHLPGTHPALLSPNTTEQNAAIQDLNTLIATSIENYRQPVLLLDSIDFDGLHYPHFETLNSLPIEELILVADDSHGFGVVGEQGKGSIEALRRLPAKELIVCGSLNKGLGLQAGVILGTEERISQMRGSPFFTGASPAAPASLASFLDAQELYRIRHATLTQNVSLFSSLNDCDQLFEYNQGHAAFSLKDPKLADHLEANGILFTRFNYPTRQETPLNRIIVSAAHLRSDIEALTETIRSFRSPS